MFALEGGATGQQKPNYRACAVITIVSEHSQKAVGMQLTILRILSYPLA